MVEETKKSDQLKDDVAAAADGAAPADPPLEDQVADLTDRLKRAHADMENLRKRTERDKEDTAKYAISKFARDVLSIGDNLQRALTAVPEGAAEADPALNSLMEGVAMTEREFLNILERNGVTRIDPAGRPFDPHQHQAMTEIENPAVAAGTVVEVYQPGYVIEGRVLRPAMVVVAKGGAKAPKAAPEAASAPGADEGQATGEAEPGAAEKINQSG